MTEDSGEKNKTSSKAFIHYQTFLYLLRIQKVKAFSRQMNIKIKRAEPSPEFVSMQRFFQHPPTFFLKDFQVNHAGAESRVVVTAHLMIQSRYMITCAREKSEPVCYATKDPESSTHFIRSRCVRKE